MDPGKRDPIADDVDRELRAHIRLEADELESAGIDPTLAEAEARRRFGNRERHAREAVRAATRGRMGRAARAAGEAARLDFRFALRSLTRTPAFAVVAILTLALGIGADTAIFSVVRGVVLRPLPLEQPDRLVWLRERRVQGGTMRVAWGNVVDWRAQSRSFAGIAPFSSAVVLVLGGEVPRRANSAVVGVDFWRVFMLAPHEGRLLQTEDHRLGSDPVGVTSYRYWMTELAGSPLDDSPGLTIETGGQRVRIVGVLPPGFEYPAGSDFWVPAEIVEQGLDRTAHNWQVVARLAEGATLENAADELDALTRRVVEDTPPSEFLATGASVTPLKEAIVGSVEEPLWMLLGAASLVLLIACTNLASTLLARGAGRERELAVRASLGAGRGRIVRQLLTESAVLATIGALAGVGLAALLLRVLRALSPAALPRIGDIRLDVGVLTFTLLMTAITALLCGILPAVRLSDTSAAGSLRHDGGGSTPGARSALWRVLVGTEVALALVLLIGSGLLIRSLQLVLAEESGFDAQDVLAVKVDLSRMKHPTQVDHARFHQALVERLVSLPGVSAAGIGSAAPLVYGPPNGEMELDGDLEKKVVANYVAASSRYFDALDIPLLRGRLPDERTDLPNTPHVAIVSRSFAEQFWPGEDPIGRQVTGGGMDDHWRARTFATVVGIVGDVRYEDLSREVYPTVYFPFTQRPYRIVSNAEVLIESSGSDPAALAGLVREVVTSLDPDAAVRMQPLAAAVSSSLSGRRFPMFVLGGFALLALVLALVGVYGVVSFGVARRQREIGIRIALGGDAARVRNLIVRESVAMVVVGLAVGVVGGIALTRLLGSLLYRVSPVDPLTFIAMAGVLFAAGWVAAWIPARAGSRVDPMVTMRSS
jgi:putative ABC transport system permease protein